MLQSNCTATRVVGYKTWESLGRQVRRGEKGMQILRPLPYKRTVIDDNGEENTVAGIKGFGLTYVWDVSQTDGEPLAAEAVSPTLLDGSDGADLFERLSAQVFDCGYTIERGDCSGANGYVDYITSTVRVRDDVTQLQAVKTLAHELAHIKLGHCDGEGTCRGAREVKAESVAYLVLDAAGLRSDDYTFAYVAGWANGSLDAVQASAAAVVDAAHKITEVW